jgi:hypothetical protein
MSKSLIVHDAHRHDTWSTWKGREKKLTGLMTGKVVGNQKPDPTKAHTVAINNNNNNNRTATAPHVFLFPLE